MNLCVIGQGVLAATTKEACAKVGHTLQPIAHKGLEVLWVCYDTPVTDKGDADYEWVINRMQEEFQNLEVDPVILISSQLPVLTTFRLRERFPRRFFACSPENIRVASALPDFMHQSRIVVGQAQRQPGFDPNRFAFPRSRTTSCSRTAKPPKW